MFVLLLSMRTTTHVASSANRRSAHRTSIALPTMRHQSRCLQDAIVLLFSDSGCLIFSNSINHISCSSAPIHVAMLLFEQPVVAASCFMWADEEGDIKRGEEEGASYTRGAGGGGGGMSREGRRRGQVTLGGLEEEGACLVRGGGDGSAEEMGQQRRGGDRSAEERRRR